MSKTKANTIWAYPLDVNENEPFQPEHPLPSNITDAYLSAPVLGPPQSGSANAVGDNNATTSS